MAHLTLGQAAKLVGKSKSTITRAIQSGKLSAQRQEDKSYRIDPAELHRVWPATVAQPDHEEPHGTHEGTQGGTLAVLQVKVEMLEAQLEREQDTVEDLRRRLDRSEERVVALSAPQTSSEKRRGILQRIFGD